jgi:hypothetical protein
MRGGDEREIFLYKRTRKVIENKPMENRISDITPEVIERKWLAWIARQMAISA